MSEAGTKQQFYYGVGRRKSAIARVRLYPGEGKERKKVGLKRARKAPQYTKR